MSRFIIKFKYKKERDYPFFAYAYKNWFLKLIDSWYDYENSKENFEVAFASLKDSLNRKMEQEKRIKEINKIPKRKSTIYTINI
jgi:hypothetical protein